MKRLRNHLIGVDQGYVSLFSDFEDGGEMWTGEGQREVRRAIRFDEPFRTRAYMSGTPTWGVLIALSDRDGPRIGIIDQPYTAERFMGGAGRARLDGPHGSLPLATRRVAGLSEATVFTTFPEIGTAAERAGFEAVARVCRLTRFGMDCYAYGLLAAGQIDLVIEAGLQPYDICAPIAVIEAAGGIVTDWQGGPAHGGGRVLAAGGPEVHAAALEILRKVPA